MTKEEWFEYLLRATNTEEAINMTYQVLGADNIKDMMTNIYPKILKSEKMDKDWAKMKETYNCRQKRSIEKYGYAMLDPDQIELAYRNNECK